jgi:hypothetical protein
MDVVTIWLRSGTAAEWVRSNPILDKGEPGFESNTQRLKIGDGSSDWLHLPYFVTENATMALITKTVADIPPLGPEQLDEVTEQVTQQLELPDLRLVWENAKA